ncbi:MAG: hypothetical protein LC126_20260 [Bryobacterales bacterium]|nr:hypothetical protein [Bryobacterales bacterium]
MRIRAHKLRDYRLEGWNEKIAGRWSYARLAADPQWRDGWISFDSVTWNPHDGLVYCGLNSIDGDLLYAFSPADGKFECLDTRRWTDEFDVKIHRTLLVNPRDRKLYFATSLLHDVERQREAKGGKVVRYDPVSRSYDMLGVPLPRLYIQSIAADWTRGFLYGFTYPAEFVFRLDIASGAVENLAYVGNAIFFAQPHNGVVDREGWLWGTCAETRAWDEITGPVPIRLFKYHPDGGRFVWFEHGLSRRTDARQLAPDPPAPEGAAGALAQTRHKDDYGFCDSMVYDGERYIYAGTTAGVLARIDTASGAVDKVARVMATGRFPALAFRDGVLYGGGGMNGWTQLMRWDTRTDRIETFNDLTDPEIGDKPARIHEIAVDSRHTLYLGENDNHARSSYLWTARLD